MSRNSTILTRMGITALEVVVVLLVFVLALFIFVPVYLHNQGKPPQVACFNNQRQIVLAVSIYAQDHKDMLPKAAMVWQNIKLDKEILICPTAGKKIPNGYVYNAAVSDKIPKLFADPPRVMVTCDGASTTGKLPNVCYGENNIAWRHKYGKDNTGVASFLDGHVEVIKTADPVWFKPEMKKTQKK